MSVTTCDLCCRVAQCIPNRHRMVCLPCTDAEISDSLRHEGLTLIEDGVEKTYRLYDEDGNRYITPRAYRYR